MKHIFHKLLWFFGVVGSCVVFSEDARVNFTMQALEPGQTDSSASFSPSSGKYTGACGGSVNESWSGVTQYTPSNCTGTYADTRWSSRVGARAGFRFDSFYLFRSLINNRQFSVVNSAGNCPSTSTNYNYILIRGKNSNDYGMKMDFSQTGTWAAGTFTYNNSSITGVSRFSLQSLTPVLQSADAFSYQSSASGCASAAWSSETPDFNDSPLGDYVSWLFGSSLAVSVSDGSNPVMTVAVPQTTLSTLSSFWQGENKNVYSGLLTFFNGRDTQDQKNVFFVPDSTGRVFTISEASALNDTTQRSSLGTLDCSTLNSPSNGFCSGTLALTASPTAAGKAVCLFSFNTNGKDLLFCAAQKPGDTSRLMTFMGGTSDVSKLSVSASPNPLNLTSTQSSGAVTVTVSNLTARPVMAMNLDALTASEKLAAPFVALSNSLTLTGTAGTGGFITGSTCGTVLPAYSTCTLQVTYSPLTYRLDKQTFRLPYDKNPTTSVNATADILASRGLSSLTMTAPNATVGGTSQAIVIATFADGSTQNVTALVNFQSSNTQLPISSSGVITAGASGSTTVTSAFGTYTASATLTSYTAAPNPSSFAAAAASTSQIDLSWASGGAGTVNYQIAYQSGASAPADCTLGTVVTAATQGSATTKSITGLTANTQYSFRVCATNGAGTLSTGVTASATTDQQTNDPSQLASKSVNSTTIFLYWTAGSGASQYQIAYQSGATAPSSCSAGTIITGATQGAVTFRSVTGLTSGTQYSFRVCSVSARGTLTSGVTVSQSTRTCNSFVACTGSADTCAAGDRAVLSGGTVTTSGTDNIHTFTSSGSISVTNEGEVLVLLVGGGGGGGGGNRAWGGGGGGGVLYGKYYLCAGTHTVTVGAGGAGNLDASGVAGGTTTLNTLSAFGGNGAGAWTGASSGVAKVNGVTVLAANAGGTGYDPGVSFSEYRAGGGGGAGGIGGNQGANNGGNGGVGLAYDISGTSLYYAGGGGGALAQGSGGTRGLGGSDVGGDGGLNGAAPTASTASRGAGGGGGGEQGLTTMGYNKKAGTAGSAGIMIFRYPQCASADGELTPCAPTGLLADAGNAQVALSWTAPSNIGAAPITDYAIQYSSNGGTSWTTFNDGISAATSRTVTGLTNGTAYVFKVAAVNAAGTSNYSSASSAVTPYSVIATGGTITQVSSGGNTYIVHTFTANDTFSMTVGSNVSVEYLIVGGGGGGGSRLGGAGGGGAGGVLSGSTTLSAGTFTVVVGGGGAGGGTSIGTVGTNGGNSSALGLTAYGGGGGGASGTNANAPGGGSGGGSGSYTADNLPGAGTVGQGNSGGKAKQVTSDTISLRGGGGGGGAGGVGSNGGTDIGGAGGPGIATTIRGTSEYFGGGGGGSGNTVAGAGGIGGGGQSNINGNGTAGTANTGGGGGGGSGPSTTSPKSGGTGGSGIVIIRYQR